MLQYQLFAAWVTPGVFWVIYSSRTCERWTWSEKECLYRCHRITRIKKKEIEGRWAKTGFRPNAVVKTQRLQFIFSAATVVVMTMLWLLQPTTTVITGFFGNWSWDWLNFLATTLCICGRHSHVLVIWQQCKHKELHNSTSHNGAVMLIKCNPPPPAAQPCWHVTQSWIWWYCILKQISFFLNKVSRFPPTFADIWKMKH